MIIIPTYNEKSNIRLLVESIRKVNQNIPILFIDDNSPDGTFLEIEELKKIDPNIDLIIRPKKTGFASAYLAGFNYAQGLPNIEYIITMDADLSHPPEVLPQMIKALETHDWVVGSRYIKGGGVKNWGLIRRILSRFANWYAKILTRIPLNDLTTGNVGYKRDFLKSLDLNQTKCQGYASLIELKSIAYESSNNFTEIPITFVERKTGESKINLKIILEGVKFPLKFFWQKYLANYKTLFALLVFLLSFGVYIKTLPDQIYLGDSPEFAAVVQTLGIPHPPGYPSFVLLAKIFTFLPIGSPEFRIGLFSAFAASLALVIFYYLFLEITKIVLSKKNNIVYFLGFISALLLAFSDMFWSQAIMIKVYSLLFLFFTAILFLLIKFWQTKKSSFLMWALFFWGFGVGVHYIILLFLPLLIVAVVLVYKDKIFTKDFFKQQINLKVFILSVLVFFLGLSVFAYLPIRSRANPAYDFSRMFAVSAPDKNLSNFIDYIRRKNYDGVTKAFVLKDKILFFNSFLENLWRQFYWLLLFVFGGLIIFWKNKILFTFLFGSIILNVFGVILLRPDSWNLGNEFLFSFYYLPAYGITVLFIGCGLVWLISRFEKIKIIKFFLVGLLIIPTVFYFLNYQKNNLSAFSFTEDYTRAILKELPKNAVLLMSFEGAANDTLMFGIPYQQIIKKFRPDVALLTYANIYPEMDRKILITILGLTEEKNIQKYLIKYALSAKEFKNRPIYTTFLTDNVSGRISQSNGAVYAFVDLGSVLKQDSIVEIDLEKDLQILKQTLFGRALLAKYFYSQAIYWQGNKMTGKAQENLVQALKYDDQIMGTDYQAFIKFRNSSR